MNRQIISLYLLLVSIISFPLRSFAQTPLPVKLKAFSIPHGARYVPGRMIVKFNESFRPFLSQNEIAIPEIEKALGVIKSKKVIKLFPKSSPPLNPTDKMGRKLVDLSLIYEISFEKSFSVEDAINLILVHEAIFYAEPRYMYEPLYVPNDILVDTTNGANGMWHLEQIKAFQAWDTQRGDTNIIISIVDAGTNLSHPDLINNISLNYDDPIDGIDNDQDGYIDNYQGWDFGGSTFDGPPDNNPSIGNVHGLWVMGNACAEADNTIGVAGVSFNCRYLAVKASADDLIGAISFGYEGIVYSADYGAQIINASWGGGIKSLFGEEVIKYASINKSAAVIVAAGNSGDDRQFYPAGFREAISVAGSFYGDTLCCQINGPGNTTFHHSVDVSAPGWRIRSTFGENNYWRWNGTSAAAPIVAGAVGLVMAKFPNLTGFQAAQRIRVTTDDIYQINTNYVEKLGTGRINVDNAINAAPIPSVRVTNFEVIDLDGNGLFQGGDTLIIKTDFANFLAPTGNLKIEISNTNSLNEIIDSELIAGIIGTEQSFSSGNSFVIKLWEFTPPNFNLEIRIGYEDQPTNYQDFEYINFRVNHSWLDVTENQLYTSVNSQGNFGFDDFGANRDGLGVVYNLESNTLFEAGFLIGNSNTQVSDRIRNNNSSRDNDFAIVKQIVELPNDQRADFVAKSVFNDSISPNPLGLEITNYTYAFQDQPYHNFVLLEYIFENKGDSLIENLHSGLFADWDLATFTNPSTGFPTTKNASDYDLDDSFVYAYDLTGGTSRYYGLSLVSDKPFKAFATTNPNSGFDFDDEDKFTALSNNPSTQTATAGINNGGEDIMHFISAGPFGIDQGEKDTLTFAVLANNSLMGLENATREAKRAYRCNILGKGPVADFSISDSVTNPSIPIQFSDNNNGAVSWSWDFGDGIQSSSKSPQHAYAQTGTYTVTLYVSDGICDYTSSQIIDIEYNTGINNLFSSHQIRLYPNPNSGQFVMEMENDFSGEFSIQLVDIKGQIVWRRSEEKLSPIWKKEIRLKELAKGLYILQASGDNFLAFEKLVIK